MLPDLLQPTISLLSIISCMSLRMDAPRKGEGSDMALMRMSSMISPGGVTPSIPDFRLAPTPPACYAFLSSHSEAS